MTPLAQQSRALSNRSPSPFGSKIHRSSDNYPTQHTIAEGVRISPPISLQKPHQLPIIHEVTPQSAAAGGGGSKQTKATHFLVGEHSPKRRAPVNAGLALLR